MTYASGDREGAAMRANRWESALDGVPTGMALVGGDGTIQWVNQAGAAILGGTREEVNAVRAPFRLEDGAEPDERTCAWSADPKAFVALPHLSPGNAECIQCHVPGAAAADPAFAQNAHGGVGATREVLRSLHPTPKRILMGHKVGLIRFPAWPCRGTPNSRASTNCNCFCTWPRSCTSAVPRAAPSSPSPPSRARSSPWNATSA
ncbi:PAS domain-containing protein [Streptomyces sp. K1PN6]|uniref:PAS domain-containing protein n=1 Tax=Streptomyces acidicola TaxID=2596892 RepID=A0A5N8WM85_9ACTN|nr:PAS domain-containing protein [Streptomyces acidicola]